MNRVRGGCLEKNLGRGTAKYLPSITGDCGPCAKLLASEGTSDLKLFAMIGSEFASVCSNVIARPATMIPSGNSNAETIPQRLPISEDEPVGWVLARENALAGIKPPVSVTRF